MTPPDSGAPTRYVRDMTEVERRYAEAMHEGCDTDAGDPPHPLSDHEPFDVEEGDEPWSAFEARLARHGLRLVIEAEARAASEVPPEPLRAALERVLAVAMTEEEDWTPAVQDEWIAAMKQANEALAGASEVPTPPLDSQTEDLLTALGERNIYSRFDLEAALTPVSQEADR